MLWHACGPKLSGSNAVCTAVHMGLGALGTGHGAGGTGHGARHSRAFGFVWQASGSAGCCCSISGAVAQFAFVSPSGRSSVGPVRAARAEPAAIHSWKFQFQKRRNTKDQSEALPQHPCQQAEALWQRLTWALGTWREYLANNSMPTGCGRPLPDSLEQNVLCPIDIVSTVIIKGSACGWPLQLFICRFRICFSLPLVFSCPILEWHIKIKYTPHKHFNAINMNLSYNFVRSHDNLCGPCEYLLTFLVFFIFLYFYGKTWSTRHSLSGSGSWADALINQQLDSCLHSASTYTSICSCQQLNSGGSICIASHHLRTACPHLIISGNWLASFVSNCYSCIMFAKSVACPSNAIQICQAPTAIANCHHLAPPGPTWPHLADSIKYHPKKSPAAGAEEEEAR